MDATVAYIVSSGIQYLSEKVWQPDVIIFVGAGGRADFRLYVLGCVVNTSLDNCPYIECTYNI